jgi:predicted RND superfamily exporter protein
MFTIYQLVQDFATIHSMISQYNGWQVVITLAEWLARICYNHFPQYEIPAIWPRDRKGLPDNRDYTKVGKMTKLSIPTNSDETTVDKETKQRMTKCEEHIQLSGKMTKVESEVSGLTSFHDMLKT